MKRTHLFLLALIVIASALGIRWRASQRPSEFVPEVAVAVGAPAPVIETTRGTLIEPTPEGDPGSAADRVQRQLASDPILEDRAHQQELAPEADARWQQAVDDAGYSANDLDESVRELFRRIDLEPRYAEGGRIEGLVITGMAPDHPFTQLGFRSGDRIDRIQGVALRDPGEIPSLLARLGPNFAICVDRQGNELCGEIQLE